MIRFVAVEILPAAMFLVPLYFLLGRLSFRHGGKTLFYFLFAFYLCAVYALVGLPNITYIRFDLSGNLIPFRDMLHGLRSTVQNVLLFVPLGIFLPLSGHRYRTLKSTVFFGFCMSMAIEVLQIFTYRATDINDLLTNTLGTMAGWLLFTAVRGKLPLMEGRRCDVPIVLLSSVCVMFFLQPFVVALL